MTEGSGVYGRTLRHRTFLIPYMGDISHDDRADFIGNTAEPVEIQSARISAGADNNHLGLVFFS